MSGARGPSVGCLALVGTAPWVIVCAYAGWAVAGPWASLAAVLVGLVLLVATLEERGRRPPRSGARK